MQFVNMNEEKQIKLDELHEKLDNWAGINQMRSPRTRIFTSETILQIEKLYEYWLDKKPMPPALRKTKSDIQLGIQNMVSDLNNLVDTGVIGFYSPYKNEDWLEYCNYSLVCSLVQRLVEMHGDICASYFASAIADGLRVHDDMNGRESDGSYEIDVSVIRRSTAAGRTSVGWE